MFSRNIVFLLNNIKASIYLFVIKEKHSADREFQYLAA